jgi:hypothetical protein
MLRCGAAVRAGTDSAARMIWRNSSFGVRQQYLNDK